MRAPLLIVADAVADRQGWLDRRRQGIGSSDIAAVCGMSPWAGPLEVWAEKIGMPVDRPANDAMRLGQWLEPTVAQIYSAQTGQQLEEAGLCVGSEDWIIATPDRVVLDANGTGVKLLEIKTVSHHNEQWGEPGTDQIPEYYLCQVQWQMAVTEYDCCDVAALFGCHDFRVYTVPRHQEFIDRLLRIGANFWWHVQSRNPPPADYTERTAKILDAIFPPRQEDVVYLPDRLERLATRYNRLKTAQKILDAKAEIAKAELIAAMGTAGKAVLPNGWEIRRKIVRRDGCHVKPTEYTTFSVKPGKEAEHG